MIELSPPISDYYNACNSQNFELLVALFSASGTIEDEGRIHHGLVEIRQWAMKTQEEYHFTLSPLESQQDENRITVTTRVSGTFPGSPIDLHFAFELDGGKISALRIGD